ncbi:hypothetical protein CLV40_10556 [Actinokineospora auranticolor]|uniref:Uncharacterized protein n=1 Tax=Actinokineospora auranticolor TaxID=155976 RepID=A0A2S6GT30_9PSEU|nr:hypothetical protein CLV40_10556 [Actinokineospora auranticolor]
MLVDRSDLLSKKHFWPPFLAWVGDAPSAPGAFGVESDEAGPLARELLDESRWPVFTVPVRDGHRVHVVMRNLSGEAGFDYLITPPRGPAVHVAALDGHFAGPGLSWPDLAVRAEPAHLLLLLPAFGDAATPPTAVDRVADALTAVGAIRDQRAVAGELLAPTASGAHPAGTSPTTPSGATVRPARASSTTPTSP